MADRELGVVFVYKQAGEQVVKQLSSNLKGVETQAHSTTTALERMAKAVERAGATEALGRPGGIMSGALGGGPGAILGIAGVGALAGVIAEADHLASSAAKLSTEVLRNSQAVGMNAESYQTWQHLTEMAGIGTDQLSRMLTHLNVQLETGAPLLKNAHTSLAAIGITTKDSGEAMLKLADYFHNSSDTAQQAAVAQGLFGRGAAGLIDILKQGSGAFQEYQKHLSDMGLLLTDAQLKQGALANTIHNEFGEALKGIELQVGVRLEAGFMQLWGTMTAVAGGGRQLFEQLGQVIGNVVAFISGAIGEIFGVSQDQIAKASEDAFKAQSAYFGLGGAAQDATAPVDALGESTKRLDQALQSQITDLTEQQKAYDNVVAAENRSIDAQIRELQLTQQQADAQDALNKAKETLAGDNAAIARDQAQLEQDMFDGNVSKAQATNLTLGSDRQKLADDTATIARDESKAQTQAAIDTLNAKKSANDEEKRQRDAAYQDAIGKLRDQVSANQQAQNSIQLADAQTVNAGKAGALDFSTFFKSMNAGNAADWAAKGGEMVTKFKGWIAEIQTAIKTGNWDQIGQDVGSAVFAGMKTAYEASGGLMGMIFGDQIDKTKRAALMSIPGGDAIAATMDVYNQLTLQGVGAGRPTPGRAAGGSVMSGQTYLVGERGPELLHMGGGSGSITPNHQLSGHTFNLNFYGVGPDVATIVHREVSAVLHQVS